MNKCNNCGDMEEGSHILHQMINADYNLSIKGRNSPIGKTLLKIANLVRVEINQLEWLNNEQMKRLEYLGSDLLVDVEYREVQICDKCGEEMK